MKVNLTEICRQTGWQMGLAIDALMELTGLGNYEVRHFIEFVFEDEAEIRDGVPEDYVTDAEYDRMSTDGHDWFAEFPKVNV